MSKSRTRLLRAGLTAAALGAALLVAPHPALAAPTSVGPMIVPVGGNATIFDPAGLFTVSAPTVQISTTSCQSKLPAAVTGGPWNATTVTKNSNSSVSFTLPSGPVPAANGGVKLYYACVYDGSTATSSNLYAGAPIYVGQPVMSSVTNGLSGGGNQITVNGGPNAPVFTSYGNVAAVFSTAPCNNMYGSTNPANLTVPNVARQSNSSVSLVVPPGVVSANGPAPTMYNLCLFDASSPTGTLITFVPYTVNLVGLSPASGSYLSSVGVTATSSAPFLSGVTTPAVLLLGSGAGCPANYSTAPMGTVTPMALNTPGAVRRLTNYRAAVTIPPLQLAPNNQPNSYQLCFYANSTNGALLGTASYTAAVVAQPTGIIPSAGPAAGGNTITVVGTDFPTEPGRITATLGGAPLTNIQPLSDKAFTAQVPAHAVEDNVALVVTTAAGTKALPGAYSFLNPIKITPNTAPNTAPFVDVSVQGTGFMSINFGSAGNAGRVFLVDGVYNGADAGNGVRANGPVAECVNVLPISDDELICTLQLNRRLNAAGTAFFDPVLYTNVLTTDVSTVAGSKIITSAGKKFVQNDLGQPIVQASNTNIPANSIITSILSAEKAVISAPALATTTSAVTATVGAAPVHSLTNALLTTAGSSTVNAVPSSGVLTGADVGRVFSGTTGIPSGTTIVSVAPGGASAMLSAPATANTEATLAGVSITGGTTSLTGSNIAATDQYAIIGANTLGIPVGTTITAASAGSATLSAPATTGGGPASITINRPVAGSLYAAAPVPEGSYHLTVVSNGAPDAASTDPDYWQTDVTSSSVFTVASF